MLTGRTTPALVRANTTNTAGAGAMTVSVGPDPDFGGRMAAMGLEGSYGLRACGHACAGGANTVAQPGKLPDDLR